MLNFKRQKSLRSSLQFEYADAKKAFSSDSLTSSVVILAMPEEKDSKKKLLADFSFVGGFIGDFLQDSVEKADSLYDFQGRYGQLAFVSQNSGALFVGLGVKKDFYSKKLLN